MEFKEIRKKTELSQADFAEKYHIPKRTLENWECGTNNCPPYLKNLLERCVIGDAADQKIDTVLTAREIRDLTGLTRKDFADKYHIKERTIVEWEAGRRHCPGYVLELLQRCVQYDERTRYYIHRIGYEITGGQSQNIICDFDEYNDAQEALSKIQRAVTNGEYNDEWNLMSDDDRKKARASLTIDMLKARELL